VRCYSERGYATVSLFVCPSVCPPVTFSYSDHILSNTSKIISRLISLRFMLGLTPTWTI